MDVSVDPRLCSGSFQPSWKQVDGTVREHEPEVALQGDSQQAPCDNDAGQHESSEHQHRSVKAVVVSQVDGRDRLVPLAAYLFTHEEVPGEVEPELGR